MSFRKTYAEILEMMQEWALYTPNAREICRRAGVFPMRGGTTGSIVEGVGAEVTPGSSGIGSSDVFWTDPLVNAHTVSYPTVKWDSIGEFADPEDPEFTFLGYDTENSTITTHKAGIWEFEASIKIQLPESYAFTNQFDLYINVGGFSQPVDDVVYNPGTTSGETFTIVLNGQVTLYLPAFQQAHVVVNASNTDVTSSGMYRVMSAPGNHFAGTYLGALPEGSFVAS